MRSGWSSASIFWVLLAWGRFPVSKAIIPDAQEHFLTPSAHRDTHLFGGLGLNGEEYRGTVLNKNEDADLAVVQVISDGDFVAVSLGSAGRVALGEDVMALGFPLSSQLGDDLTVTRGIISARRQFEAMNSFKLTRP